MKKVTLVIDDFLFQFYKKVGENAGGIKPEQVIVDSLFKLAGELSVAALNEKNHPESKTQNHR